jgi:hypothetical protein
MKLAFFTLSLVFVSVAQLHAVTTFAVNATANATLHGYNAGQSYNFVFTTNDNITDVDPSSQFTSTQTNWEEEFVSQSSLWSSISGDAVNGSYVRPTGSNFPNSYIFLQNTVASPFFFELLVGNDGSTGIGVTTPSAAVIRSVKMTMPQAINFTYPQTFVEPNQYFLAYNGTYSLTNSSSLITVDPQAAGLANVTFTPSTLTIISSPVPEPSGALLSLLGLASLHFLRRRS